MFGNVQPEYKRAAARKCHVNTGDLARTKGVTPNNQLPSGFGSAQQRFGDLKNPSLNSNGATRSPDAGEYFAAVEISINNKSKPQDTQAKTSVAAAKNTVPAKQTVAPASVKAAEGDSKGSPGDEPVDSPYSMQSADALNSPTTTLASSVLSNPTPGTPMPASEADTEGNGATANDCSPESTAKQLVY